MANVPTTIELYANKISGAVKRREYDELAPIMADIFLRQDRLSIIVDLADQLPSSVLEDFFLCGLGNLVNLRDSDYRKMFELASGRGVATYHLARFLIVHGGVKKRALQALSHNFDEIQNISQFSAYLDDAAPLAPNEVRMNQHIYRTLKVSMEQLMMYRAKFL